jgi:hypothetical protein
LNLDHELLAELHPRDRLFHPEAHPISDDLLLVYPNADDLNYFVDATSSKTVY